VSSGGTQDGSPVPVVVFDRSGGAWAFSDIAAAGEWMEAIDVDDGEYDAYDANGCVLSISVVDGRVVVDRTAGLFPAQALERLRTVLSASPVAVGGRTLPEMIGALLDQERTSRIARVVRRIRRLVRH